VICGSVLEKTWDVSRFGAGVMGLSSSVEVRLGERNAALPECGR
jgi:hypothetical protein